MDTGHREQKKEGRANPKRRDAAVIAFGLTLAVLLVGGVLGYVNAGRLADDSRRVAHTHEVIGSLETLLSTLKDAETGQRGYLLAEDEKYLEPYDDALKRMATEVARLTELTADNPDQQARLAVLDKKIAVRLNLLKQTVASMKAGDRPAALKFLRDGSAKASMDDVRRDIAAMQQVEHDLLKKRADESEASRRATVWSILLPALIGVVLVGVVFYLSRRNVQQKHRAAFVLAEQKERLRTTLASIGDGVISADRGGNVTYLNAVAESLTGWTTNEAAGVPLTRVFHIVNESTRQPVENPALRALKEGVIVGLANHTVLIAKDGKERPIDDSAAPIRCELGEVVGSVLVFRDITERKREEERFRQQAEWHRVTLASIGDAVLTTDADGNITYLNAVAEDLTGWTQDAAYGKPMTTVFQIVNETTRQPVENPVEKVLTSGQTVGLANHTILVRRDGTERAIDDSAAPIRDAAGGIVGVVLVFHDVTAHRQAEAGREEALRQTVTTLESITDGFMRFDRDWRIVYVNAEAERINQRPRAELLGKNHWELFPATVGTKLETEYRRAAADGVTVELENYYEPWGRWFEIKGYPSPDGGVAIYFRDITDRKQAENERLRLAAIVENSPDYIGISDAEGTPLYVNPAGRKLVGLDPDRDVGRTTTIPEYFIPEEHALLKEVVLPTNLKDGRWAGELTFRHWKTGEAIPVSCELFRVDDLATGRPVYFATVIQDIRERKRAEEQLRRSAELLTVIIDRSPTGFYIVDSQFRISHINADSQARAFRNVNPAVGRRLDDAMRVLWPEPLATELIAIFRHTLDTGEPYRSPGLVSPRADLKSVETYEWQLDRITMPDGTHAVVCYFYDTTRLREAEAEARESEERFRTLADNIPQLAWIADAGTDGQVHWFNRNWFDYTGTTLDEMKGAGWHAVHHPDHAERVIQKFQHHVKASLDWEDTFPLRGRDGEYRWFLSRMKVIRDESGTAVRIFGTNTDITEQRDTANELRKLSAEMSEAARRKDEFLATLAHELRNPLAPLRNGLQVMRLAGTNGTVEQARTMMERQLTQLVRLVDDLLDVSRVTSGKLDLRRERVELKAVIDNAVEIARPLIEQAGHEFVVAVPDEPIFVDGDTTRLAQVVSNLLNNSTKYTHRGGHVRLAVGREDGMAVVSVADDGIGIPPDMLGKVFEMFTQVDRALEKTTGGLGIGLSLVKGLVEMHGGTIEARSEGEGRGSEFIMRLPVVLSAVQKVEPPKADEPVGSSGRRRILVADDNVDAADSLGQLLELLGNDVSTANDGLQAVDLAESFRPDVILLDIGMPKLNGYETCRRIREQPWGKTAVVVALTGWGQDEDKRRSQEAGFDHHLVKPVDPSALAKLLAGLQPTT